MSPADETEGRSGGTRSDGGEGQTECRINEPRDDVPGGVMRSGVASCTLHFSEWQKVAFPRPHLIKEK